MDGDTIVLRGERLPLLLIDAPETDQLCLQGSKLYACGITLPSVALGHDFVRLDIGQPRHVCGSAGLQSLQPLPGSLLSLIEYNGQGSSAAREGFPIKGSTI